MGPKLLYIMLPLDFNYMICFPYLSGRMLLEGRVPFFTGVSSIGSSYHRDGSNFEGPKNWMLNTTTYTVPYWSQNHHPPKVPLLFNKRRLSQGAPCFIWTFNMQQAQSSRSLLSIRGVIIPPFIGNFNSYNIYIYRYIFIYIRLYKYIYIYKL